MFYPLKYIFRLPITSKRTTNKKEGHCPRFTAQQRQFWLQMITLGKGTWASLKTYTFSIGGITWSPLKPFVQQRGALVSSLKATDEHHRHLLFYAQ